MRKKTVLDRIVLRAKAGIVSDADFNSDAIDQRLQVFLEDVVAGVVVAAGVAQPCPLNEPVPNAHFRRWRSDGPFVFCFSALGPGGSRGHG